MIRELRSESPTLTELNDKFRHVAKEIDILTCYELSPTKTAIEVSFNYGRYRPSTNNVQMPDGSWKREGPPIMMVSLDSARQWYPREELLPCNADHSQIAKLKRGENSIYPSVRWAIKKALLSAGDLYSEAKGIHHDENHHLGSVDEASTTRRSLLHVTHRRASMPSNDRIADPAPTPSRAPSGNAIDQQIRRLPQVKVDQPAHRGDRQIKSSHFNETIPQWRSGIEVSEREDTRSSANPKSAETDMASMLFDEDGAASKSTELTISLGAEFPASKEAKQETNPDPMRKEDDETTALQMGDSKVSTNGSKSMVMGKVIKSAIIGGDEIKTRELLAYCYNVNCKDDHGITPLLLAAYYKHENILRLLLEQGAHPNARCNKGKTTLHWLASVPEIPIAETLIDLLLRNRPPLEVANGEGLTPLMNACLTGELLLATRLIGHGANVRATNSRVETALHYAADGGKAQMIPLLVSNGAELEAKTFGGLTPLHRAVFCPSDPSDTVEQLIQAGADKEARTGDSWLRSTPLHIAIRKHNKACVSNYLESGLNEWRPLHVAADEGSLEIIKALLDRGANIEASGPSGCRPLHIAVQEGQIKIVKVFLDRGANIEAPDSNGYSPLHFAAWGGQLEIVKALLDHGANPTSKTSKLVGSKPSGISMRDSVSSTQKQAVRALLKEAEKTWKQSSKK